MKESEDIKANAEKLIEKLRPISKINFGYNKESVHWLQGYIERLRRSEKFKESEEQFVSVFGSYLGECIIQRHGGHWENRDGIFAVAFDDQNYVLPFNRVKKQWQNGLEDGIADLFDMIPELWNRQSKDPQ